MAFTLGPMVSSFYLSLTRYDLHQIHFVGAENYRRLISVDPLFWKSFSNTLIYSVFSVPLGIAASLGIALLLNQKVAGQPVFRTLFYLPSLVPAVATALLWQWIFNTDNGALNLFLGLFGLPSIQWLQDPRWTMTAFVAMSLWGVGGARMIIFLAGLQGIADGYYEAATLDGAGAWTRFIKVTLPLLSPVMFFNLILGVIGSFQTFTTAYVLTNGGPKNATLFYSLYLFRNAFEYFKLGKASAMAWMLFGFLLVLTSLQFSASRRWVYYDGEARA